MVLRPDWSDDEIAILRAEYPHKRTDALARRLGRSLRAVYGMAHKIGLRKSAEYLDSPAACRLRRSDDVGKDCRFKKGHMPWNKGKAHRAGGRSAETRFKPGHRPQTWVPVGTEVVDSDGYRKVKVRDDAPAGRSRENWVFVHVQLWADHHGPVPRSHAIVFRNGDKSDIRIDNLELVSRQELMRRNTVHNLPKALADVVQLRGALLRVINRKTRSQSDEKQD